MLKLLKERIKSNKFLQIEKIRCRLKQTNLEIVVRDAGAGSRFDQTYKRSIKNILRKSCSSLPKSLFINFFVRKYNSQRVLELGTCLGVNALHIASLNRNIQIISVDADPNLIRYARQFGRIIGVKNVKFINAFFDDVLEDLLKTFQPDFIFMDGNHRYNPTLKYFKKICDLVPNKAVILIDDIDWSREMKEVWKDINCQRIKAKRNLLKLGLIIIE